IAIAPATGATADGSRATGDNEAGSNGSKSRDAKQERASVSTVAAGAAAPPDADLSRALAALDPSNAPASVRESAHGAAQVGHSDASERIARMLKIQDESAERTLSQVLLRIDHPD